MRDTGIPNGLSAVGYGERDIASLVEGTLKQPRLLAGAHDVRGPCHVSLLPECRRILGHRRRHPHPPGKPCLFT
jgi:hypothetical protein